MFRESLADQGASARISALSGMSLANAAYVAAARTAPPIPKKMERSP
jgi:hypothetical protein